MEPYSSDISPQSREDSLDYRPRSTPRIAGTESSFTSLNSISASTEPSSSSFATTSTSSALGLYHPLDGQTQPSQSRAQVSSSQSIAPLLQFDSHWRYSKPYNSGSPLPIQSSLSQNANLQPWDYPEPSQEQSPTALLQLNRGIDQNDSVARSKYDSGSQQPLQANMSIMGPQYFSGIETSLNRSSHTWPVFEQQQNFTEENRFVEPFNEHHGIPRPQSTSSTPPRMMPMSLPSQRESRQLHQVRRDSKTRFRRERSHSNPYNLSLSTTPEAVPRSLPLDNYSLGRATSDVAQSRMPLQHFTAPLQLAGHQQSDVYEQQYQLSMPDYPNNYLLPYSTAALNPRMSSYSGRALPTTSILSPDLGTYCRQTSSSSLASNQSQQHDTAGDPVRVLLTRPKPQCWEHGCNGRAFSTFSNLLRHQREKNGVAAKPTCPNCGAEFTRTTARNGHMAHEKCKKA